MIESASEAKNIIRVGVLPGEIDSLDIAEARGGIDALQWMEIKALIVAGTELKRLARMYPVPATAVDAIAAWDRAIDTYYEAVDL